MQIKNIIVILGAPGSGKGTQGKLLAKQLGYEYLSMGQYLRNYALGAHPHAAEVKQVIDRGEIISDDLFEPVFDEAIKNFPQTDGVVFDGFPRDSEQIPTLEKFIKLFGVENVKAVFLDVPKEKLLERIHERQKVEGRADDNPKVIVERFDEYIHKTLPVINFFEQNFSLIKIDGDKPIDEVSAEISKKILG